MKLSDKWRAAPETAKASIIFMLTSFLVSGMSFFTTPVFTRLMSSSEYGKISTYNSWVSIIDAFAALGFTSAGVINVGLNEYRDNRKGFIASVVFLCNISTLVTFAAVKIIFRIIGYSIMGYSLFLPDSLMLLMFIHFLFYPAYAIWLTRQRYEYKYRSAAVISVLASVLGQAASLWAVICFKDNPAEARLWANELIWLVVYLAMYFMIAVKNIRTVRTDICRNMLVFAVPMIPHYLAQHIMLSSDRIMISEFADLSSAGIYNLSSNICSIVMIMWSAVNASLAPYTYNKLNNNEGSDVGKVSHGVLLLYAAVCLAVTLAAPEIIRFLAPNEYYGGIYVIPPMTAAAFVSALYNIYANVEFYYKRKEGITAATIAASAVNVTLNFIFIPRYGYIAAAYTTLASYIVLAAINYMNYKKCPVNSIYNDRLVLLLTVAAAAGCMACAALYSYTVIRYAVVLAAVAAVFVKRKSIIKVIEHFRV